MRRHINVFVNGEYGGEQTPVADGDRVDVLPAISGRGERVAEPVVGTRKGCFVLAGEPGAAFDVRARAFSPRAGRVRDP